MHLLKSFAVVFIGAYVSIALANRVGFLRKGLRTDS